MFFMGGGIVLVVVKWIIRTRRIFVWGIRGIASVMYLSLISRGLIKILLTLSLPHWRTQITRSQVKLNELCGKTSMEQL
ncbi:hypothetical protein BHF94_07855 [Corynebacterium diphtheriae]|nr:hypothetical protein BHF94_07855 [Corynebacterium diphtheriae]